MLLQGLKKFLRMSGGLALPAEGRGAVATGGRGVSDGSRVDAARPCLDADGGGELPGGLAATKPAARK